MMIRRPIQCGSKKAFQGKGMCYGDGTPVNRKSFMSVSSACRTSNPKSGRAFTLVELLVVLAIIAIIASLILPALARARSRAQGSFCLNNTRQLAVAWMIYADEHNGQLAYNLGHGRTAAATPSVGGVPMSDNWVNNVESWELSSDNTNATAVVETGLGPFTSKSTALYRCPSDNVVSDLQRTAGWQSRVRSYSMNAMIGDAGTFSQTGVNINNSNYVQFFKVFSVPHPSDIFVFLDEHPDSIDDGYFLNSDAEPAKWTDLPASYHGGAASFSFADGHSELHRWHNASTKQPARAYGINPPLPMVITDGLQDFGWVLSRMSIERYPDNKSYGN
jgi:prepilin-type N-terminal cleavage/methylation domain-containing protein/prepilin-type processing-associated H-X9-DG protein